MHKPKWFSNDIGEDTKARNINCITRQGNIKWTKTAQTFVSQRTK